VPRAHGYFVPGKLYHLTHRCHDRRPSRATLIVFINLSSNTFLRSPPPSLKRTCALDERTLELLKFAMNDLRPSARAYDQILKVARTIANLSGSEGITPDHISEAIQFRSLDRQLWT
jgi:predicted ATPase with chaperone activity